MSSCPASAGPSGSGGLPDILFDLSVPQMDRAMRERGDFGFVRNEDDGVARLMQAGEERHDFAARLRIEVAGWLVGKQDRRVVHQRAGDGYALTLSPDSSLGL